MNMEDKIKQKAKCQYLQYPLLMYALGEKFSAHDECLGLRSSVMINRQRVEIKNVFKSLEALKPMVSNNAAQIS